ncbi:PilN domain-containing protein [Thermochromatium tepidum]|uniref:Pilus assembly protein PilN n=1 Tax=Thermochromatium tepidum ATCC 43061 TaxID=316276 RepID=A0A6I6EAM5_THETI|nr:PilN domain-containing protein [Thermochromatium tepidum]QGU33658.1 pilus assembly protein PilN [Thermochromatium tepidum ATCC 43061]
MVRLNLLPWREAARQQRRQEFLTALGIALALTGVVIALVHFYFEDRISGQQARNRYLRTEIAVLDRKIKEIEEIEKTKADLLARMAIIQRLQKSRPDIVRLFDELVTALPEGVYLTKLEQSERSITVEGRAQSNARVSAFMRQIEGSRSIGQPRLMLIENQDKTGKERSGIGFNRFRLSFDQISPGPESTKTTQ